MTDTEWLDKSEAAWKRVYGDWVPDSLKDVPRLFALARRAVAAEAERDELKRVLVEANAHRLVIHERQRPPLVLSEDNTR